MMIAPDAPTVLAFVSEQCGFLLLEHTGNINIGIGEKALSLAAGIDFKDQVGFYELIQRINAEKGVTVLLASHDTSMVAKQAHHVLCLKDGHVQCQGPPESTLTPETLAQIFGPQSTLFRHHHH